MDFLECSKPFLKFYYLTGISPYRPEDDQLTNLRIFLFSKYLQAISCVLVGLYAIRKVNVEGAALNFRQTEIHLIQMYVAFDTLRSIFVFIKCVLHRQMSTEILSMFGKLERYFAQNLNHQISYKPLVKNHIKNMIIMIGTYFAYFCLFFVRVMVHKNGSPIGSPFRIMQIMQTLTFLHIIFYIDVLCFHLAQLNHVIERDTNFHFDKNHYNVETSKVIDIQLNLKYYKTIHFKLWETSRKHNAVFGWCTIALLMLIFIDLVYSTFWLFDEFTKNTGIIRIFRK